MKGKIVQVSGPVVDVEFEGSYLPAIKDALYVIQDGKKKTMEVSQHIGNNVVRCIMLAASEGLCKDMEVTATGSGISVPVGEKTLGRLFNVLGDTLDNGEKLDEEEHWCIHRNPPTFAEQSPVVSCLPDSCLHFRCTFWQLIMWHLHFPAVHVMSSDIWDMDLA